MNNYTLIDTAEKLKNVLQLWKDKQINTIACDFEGEFNLHVYGEHLCLIQLYDQSNYYLVDPLALVKEDLALLLEDEKVELVMFDCASDAALVRKQYAITLKGVYDIRIGAQLLGLRGNLTSLMAHFLNIEATGSKKGNQKANWLIRPLTSEMITYALGDVEHLFALRSAIDRELKNQGLFEKNLELQQTVALAKRPDRPGYEKLDGWRFLSKKEKLYVAAFFMARDQMAQKLNWPPYRVLGKKQLVLLGKQGAKGEADLAASVSHLRPSVQEPFLKLLSQAREKVDQKG
ncbi:MAG: 3'-5' exonuclease [Sphaerochaetaceae bacterium]